MNKLTENKLRKVIRRIIKEEMNLPTFDIYNEAVEEVQEKIKPFIEDGKKEIKEEVYRIEKEIRKEYEELDADEFAEKYREKIQYRGGRYFKGVKFKNSLRGKLLFGRPGDREKIITRLQKEFEQKENSKVESLFFKLKKKYPNITQFQDFQFEKGYTDGVKFNFTGSDNDNNTYDIHTYTIVVDGYNIQTPVLQWLMSVKDQRGKKVTITQEV